MRFLTKPIIKLKLGEIPHYRIFSFIHIYVKKNTWEKYELKNQSIILLYNNLLSNNSIIRKVKNKDYEFIYLKFLSNLYKTKIRLIFIDKDKSYFYENERLYKLNINRFNFSIESPIHQQCINIFDFNDNELLDIINSYNLLNELNEEI